MSESDWHMLMRVLADRPKGRFIVRPVMLPGQLYFTITVDLKSDSVTVFSYQTEER